MWIAVLVSFWHNDIAFCSSVQIAGMLWFSYPNIKFYFDPMTSSSMADSYEALTHFMPSMSFYSSWKTQKSSGFLMFSGAIERDQWHEMGQWRGAFLSMMNTFSKKGQSVSKKNGCWVGTIFVLFVQIR